MMVGSSAVAPGNTAPLTGDQIAAIRARIRKLNDGALALGAVAFGLQAYGRSSGQGALVFAGAGFMIGGLALYARMRGRSPWWGLLGLLSLLGLLILYFLPKHCHHCGLKVKGKSCTCGAPAPL